MSCGDPVKPCPPRHSVLETRGSAHRIALPDPPSSLPFVAWALSVWTLLCSHCWSLALQAHPPKVAAFACLFLAGKVEESMVSIKHFVLDYLVEVDKVPRNEVDEKSEVTTGVALYRTVLWCAVVCCAVV